MATYRELNPEEAENIIGRDFETEKFCGSVEWLDFFDYAQRIHKRLLRG